jgi:hypothetical protein
MSDCGIVMARARGPELRRRRRAPALNTRDGETDIGIPAEFSAIAPIVVGVPSGR